MIRVERAQTRKRVDLDPLTETVDVEAEQPGYKRERFHLPTLSFNVPGAISSSDQRTMNAKVCFSLHEA